jgi:hypothetical protein
MRRLLVRSFCLCCATLCGLAIAAAVRSHFTWDRIDQQTVSDTGDAWRWRWVRVNSSAGVFDLWLLRETSSSRARLAFVQANWRPATWSVRPGRNDLPGGGGVWRRLGFYGELRNTSEGSFLRVALPYWLPASVFAAGAILPIYVARRRLRRDRVRRKLCPACGYDLRATPDRCPECGAPVTGAAQSVTMPA